jgi:hypothetical protein
MNVSRDEAARALGDIDKAAGKVIELKGYHHGAPHFIVWGLVWLFANTATQFWPAFANYYWPSGILLGAIASTVIGIRPGRKIKRRGAATVDFAVNRKIGMTSGMMFLLIISLTWLAQPETSRQTNAMISIFFPFLSMCGGIWIGWRLFAIGLFTAAMILIDYFYIGEWYDLWMGVFAGGSLIAGGLWLRAA